MTHATSRRRRRLAQEYLPPLLRIPYQAFIAQLHEELTAAGYPEVRPAHGMVFQHLSAEGSRVTELAERSQVSKQWMGTLVDDLEARGYLVRVPDPTDGRAKVVRLTEQGQELLGVAQGISRRVEAAWAARVGERRLQQLRRLLVEVILSLGVDQPVDEVRYRVSWSGFRRGGGRRVRPDGRASRRGRGRDAS